jgi:signal transduction histidine kinase
MAAAAAQPSRVGPRFAWLLWVLAVALAISGGVLVILNDHPILGNLTVAAIYVSMGFVGALIASRQSENPIGWVLLGSTVVIGLAFATSEYSVYAAEGPTSPLPGATWAAWVGTWAWVVGLGPILTLLFLLFPDGRPPSPRWRPVVQASVVVIGLTALFGAVDPQADLGIPGTNPLGIDALGTSAEGILGIGFMLLVVLGALSVASLFIRFRDARGDERQQIKWLALSATLVATWIALSTLGEALGIEFLRDSTFMEVFSTVAILSIPVAVGIAMLRYRLYEIDVVIRKTVVVAVVVAFITIVYVGIVVGMGALVAGTATEGPLPIIAAVVIAVAFQPVRARANRIANHLVLGERATPYEVLSAFSERLVGAYESDDLLTRMATLIGEGTGVRRVVVWLKIADDIRPAASWPPEAPDGSPASREQPRPLLEGRLPELGASRTLEVRHEGELLGAISVVEHTGEPLSHEADRLLQHLASQAGLVLRNALLTEELRARLVELQASRKRIVAAQDERAKQLERNIHDGAQQQLVALAVKLRVAEGLAEREPARTKAMLAELQADATSALEDLRDLARGIYPPLLADKGLPTALEAQARKAPLPVSVAPDGVGRYAPEIESALYFCCLEALQNVAKYAHATRADVRLSASAYELAFEVVDDGDGFDPSSSHGTGLQGMEDRMEALGGRLEIHSQQGGGTSVIGRIPAPPSPA